MKEREWAGERTEDVRGVGRRGCVGEDGESERGGWREWIERRRKVWVAGGRREWREGVREEEECVNKERRDRVRGGGWRKCEGGVRGGVVS